MVQNFCSAAMMLSMAAMVLPASAAVTDLMISEVVEGNGGNFKYIEIFNNGSSSVDLTADVVALRRYTNGASTVGATIALTGTLPAGGRYLVANNQTDLNTVYGAGVITADKADVNINHNGNDFYDLVYSATPIVIDAFGKDQADATDPGSIANDLVAFRVRSALPNNGDWGTARPADNGTTANGYWTVKYIGATNAGASTSTTPKASGGAAGVEVPVALSGFTSE